MELAWVCIGGAFGSGARFLVGTLAARHLPGDLPWGTLLVNVVGSFLLAMLMQVTVSEEPPTRLRLALGTGAMGGFTTYSTYNLEMVRMVERGAWGLVTGYFLLTVVSCIFGGLLGHSLPRVLR